MRRSSLLAAVTCLCAGLVLAFPPSAVADPRDDLEATQDRIDDALEDLRAIEAEAEATEEAVAAADARVRELEADLNLLLEQIAAQEARVDDAEQDAATALAEADRIEDVVAERARRAFMGSTPPNFAVFSGLGSQNVAGALDGLALLEALTARADASLEGLDAARVVAEASAVRLTEEVELLEDVRSTHEQVLAEATSVLEARSNTLRSLEAERERQMADVEQLEAEAEELQQVIAQRAAAARRAAEEAARRAAAEAARQRSSDNDTSTSQPAPAPAPAGGCYAWPARGRVTSEYGPRWGRMHAGLDIDGDTGDPIVAAQSGVVIFAGWYSGYGNLTLIAHSDGVTTAYAHQSSIGVREDQAVARGEFIGRLGATGRVTGSHLHFETRTSSGTRNPRNYLC